MSKQLEGIVADTLKRFDWDNYGLDEVGQLEYDDWAKALAAEVVEAIGKAERNAAAAVPNGPGGMW